MHRDRRRAGRAIRKARREAQERAERVASIGELLSAFGAACVAAFEAAALVIGQLAEAFAPLFPHGAKKDQAG